MKKYMGLDSERASELIENLFSEVKSVNGTLISIWHNESLCNEGMWKGWRQVFEKMLGSGLADLY